MILYVEIIWNQMKWMKRHTPHILSFYSSFAQHIKSGSWDQRNWHDWAGHCGWHQDHALENSTSPTLRSAVEKCFFGPRPGCIRIGNTGEVTLRPMVDGLLTDAGGMLDNVVMSRLYRPGSVSEPSSFVVFLSQVNVHMTVRLRDIFGTLQLSDYQLTRCVMLLPEVAYVSKSGGMSNELVCQTCICACEPWCPTSMSITWARITSSPGIPMEFMKVLPLEATGGPVGPVGPGSVQYVEVA